MKTQMRFQKLILKITLILSALAIVYALAFCTGAIAYISYVTDAHSYSASSRNINNHFGGEEESYYALVDLFYLAQDYTEILLILGIVFILLVVVAYAFASSGRRNYYASNYITVGLLAIYAIVWAVIAIAFSLQIQSGVLSNVAWANFEEFAAGDDRYMWSDSTWIYVVGYILSALVIVDALALIYNLIWKAKLMKGEKALLENGLVKEVA